MTEPTLTKIDEIDREILSELDHNSRQSIAELAAKLNLQRDRITYRIKKLTEQGVLVATTTTVNPYKYNLVVYKMYLRLQNDQARIKKLVAKIKNHPNTYWVGESDGKWDLMLAIFARHPAEFRSFQQEILTDATDLVISFAVYTLTDSFLFRKRYLGKKSSTFMRLGGHPGSVELEEIDFKMLKLLALNSRLTITELAQNLRTTPRIVQSHLSRLEKLGVILGYRVILDFDRLGISHFKAQLQLTSTDPSLEARIFDYCRGVPNITYVVQQLGDCVLELELEVDDYPHYNALIADLRAKFADEIREIETILIRKQFYRF
ncbi:Lrp/AsnC family transcriptional regulator [bacterium]|nr:Lrp/AsnC family transcriptional regulator [bacterium]